jgi:hypothetical protein
MDTRKYRRYCIDLFKINNGCSICGYDKHPCALCFDHLPEYDKHPICKNGYSKSNNCGGMQMLYSKKYPVGELISEIKKCRILCMNCHMEHTYSKHISPGKYEYTMSIDELERLLNQR